MHTVKWMNVENMTSERNQTQVTIYQMTTIVGNVQNGGIHRRQKVN